MPTLICIACQTALSSAVRALDAEGREWQHTQHAITGGVTRTDQTDLWSLLANFSHMNLTK